MTIIAMARDALLAPADVTVYLLHHEHPQPNSDLNSRCESTYTVFFDISFDMNAVDCDRLRRRAMDCA